MRDITHQDLQARLAEIDRVIAQGPYTDDWDSLCRWQAPQWFRDAKFGIFLHWGLYSVPAYANEWYSRNMYIQGMDQFNHHVQTYGPQKDFGYKDFIPLFKAERFDPAAWAELFQAAGARYVVPVAEHHDGFQMYKSGISHWNAYEMGPKRDIVGDLSQKVNDFGLINGASSHRAEHWWFMGHGKEFDSDVKEPMQRGDFYWPAMPEPAMQDPTSEPFPTEEYLNDWLVRTAEIVDRFDPKILYFDWWIIHKAFRPYIKKLAAYYYNRAAERGYEPVIAYKHDSFMFGSALPDIERGQFAAAKPYAWQTDTACALNSWCHTEQNVYRDPASLLQDLIDIVSKNGNLLLNVGPKADGTISPEDTAILTHIGSWLHKNGEAVYGTRPWRICGEGPTEVKEGFFTDGIKKEFTSKDFRFTQKGDQLYAIALRPAADGRYDIRTLALKEEPTPAEFSGIIHNVHLVEDGSEISWTRDGEALHLTGPTRTDGDPVAFRITLE